MSELEKQEMIAKLDLIEKSLAAAIEKDKRNERHKRELIDCLLEVGKEVQKAGGYYLSDKIATLLKKVVEEDLKAIMNSAGGGVQP